MRLRRGRPTTAAAIVRQAATVPGWPSTDDVPPIPAPARPRAPRREESAYAFLLDDETTISEPDPWEYDR